MNAAGVLSTYPGWVVLWPFILLLPAVYFPRIWIPYLAVMPAAVLVVWPADTLLPLPWLVFGSSLSINDDRRWLVVLWVVVGLLAAKLLSERKRTTLFFLITLSGGLGAVLSHDLVSFTVFSTMVGYGFYGLLLDRSDAETVAAARLYLIYLIVADLILFEALLLAAYSLSDLTFVSVRQSVTDTNIADAYVWMVSVGFVLKAGAWPAHLWLQRCYNHAGEPALMMLAAVPVTTAWMGMLKWLPFGETFFLPGTVLQGIAVLAAATSVLALIKSPSFRMSLTRLIVVIGGLFNFVIGTGLAHPQLWTVFHAVMFPFVSMAGLLSAVWIVFSRVKPPVPAQLQRAPLRLSVVREWIEQTVTGLSRLLMDVKNNLSKSRQRIVAWFQPDVLPKRYYSVINTWGFKMLLFLLIGIVTIMLGWE